jgi:hypothetical protein
VLLGQRFRVFENSIDIQSLFHTNLQLVQSRTSLYSYSRWRER